MSFQIGDKIVYPMYGAGVIEATEYKEIFGEKKLYYLFRLPYGKMKIFISSDSLNSLGVRPLTPKEEIPEVIKILTGTYKYETDTWSKRQQENSDRLRKGDIESVAIAYAMLTARESAGNISAGEKRLKTNVTNIFFSELALSLDIDFLEVGNYVRDELNKLRSAE